MEAQKLRQLGSVEAQGVFGEESGVRGERWVRGQKSTGREVDRGSVARHHCLLGCLGDHHSLHVYKGGWLCDPRAELC